MARLKRLTVENRGEIIIGDSCRYITDLDNPKTSGICEAKVSIVRVTDNGCVVKIEKVNINKKEYPLIEGHEIVALWSELWV